MDSVYQILESGSTKQVLESLRSLPACQTDELHRLVNHIMEMEGISDEVVMVAAMMGCQAGMSRHLSEDLIRQAWIDLGILRSQFDANVARILIELGLEGKYGTGSLLLTARALEALLEWLKGKDEPEMLEWLPLLQSCLFTDDELLQQKSREAMASFGRKGRLLPLIVETIAALDATLKVKYQLVRDLAPFSPAWPRTTLLKDCSQALLTSASLAPAAADALGALNLSLDELKELLSMPDEDGHFSYFLMPRLVRARSVALHEWLQSHQLSPLWVRAAACLIEAKRPNVPSVSREDLSLLLHDLEPAVRQDAWILACHLNDYELIERFCIDMQINDGAEDRQRCLATLRHWLRTQVGQLYIMEREQQDLTFILSRLERLFRSNSFLAPTLPFGRLQWSMGVIRAVDEALLIKVGEGAVAQRHAQRLAEFRATLWSDVDLLHCLVCVMLDSSFGQIQRDAHSFLQDKAFPGDLLPVALQRLASPREPVQLGAALALSLLNYGTVELILAEIRQESLESHRVNGLLVYLALRLKLDESDQRAVSETCREIATKLFPLAAHPSPEGLSNDEEVDGHAMLTLAWRTIREATGILAMLDAAELLEENVRFIVHGLLTLRHPGAFNALAEPLAILARRSPVLSKQILQVNSVSSSSE